MKPPSLTIACIAADLNPGALGGAEVAAVETIKRLSRKHHLIVFVGNKTNIRSLLPKNITVIPVYYPRIPSVMGLFYIFFGTPQIAWHLFGVSIDVLWAKQEFPQAIVAALIKKMVRKPLYVTIQNPRMHEEELVLSGPLRLLSSLLTPILSSLLSWAYRQADVLAAVSTHSARETKKMGGNNVVVIPNGVNINEFHVRGSEFGIRNSEFGTRGVEATKKTVGDSFTIVSTSSLIPRNGIDVLIEAVGLLPKELLWNLVIAGDGPEQANLKSQTSNIKHRNRISFLGRVDNQDIPKLLAQADLFVRPSRKEGFGVSFIEAMAAGVPVIATPVGGIPDFITHKQTGLLVPPDDPQALAEAIESLCADTNLQQLLTTNAFHLIQKNYTWDNIVSQVETTMANLLLHNS